MIIKIDKLFTKIVLFSGILSMASCLKDDAVDNHERGVTGTEGPEWVSIPKATKPNKVNVVVVESSSQVQNLDLFEVAYDFVDAAKSDITVTLQVDNSTVATANPSYVVLPASAYTFPSTSVTIPAGERLSGAFKIALNTSTLDPKNVYALGIKIASTSSPSVKVPSNLGDIVIAFNVKNKYDGKYKLTFKNYHPTSNPGYTGASTTVELRTVGPNSVKIYWPAVPGFFNPAILAGGLSYFGAQEPEYTIDATNKVTVQNSYSGATTFYTMNISSPSVYDPVTKTIDTKWGYSYTVPGVFDAACREWTQKFEYIGPR